MDLNSGLFFDKERQDEEFLDMLAALIKAGEPATSRLSPERAEKFKETYYILKTCVSGDINITSRRSETFRDHAFITVKGKRIICDNPNDLLRAMKNSGGLEICPMTNGDVTISLSFNKMLDRSTEGGVSE